MLCSGRVTIARVISLQMPEPPPVQNRTLPLNKSSLKTAVESTSGTTKGFGDMVVGRETGMLATFPTYISASWMTMLWRNSANGSGLEIVTGNPPMCPRFAARLARNYVYFHPLLLRTQAERVVVMIRLKTTNRRSLTVSDIILLKLHLESRARTCPLPSNA